MPWIEKWCIGFRWPNKFHKIFDSNVHQSAVLSPVHKFTVLLVRHYHKKFQHRRMKLIINEIRQNWLIHDHAVVNFAFPRCLKCRIEKCKPMQSLMSQIPEEGLKWEIRRFVNTGMDYFAPILKIARRIEKRRGILFTSFAVRAIPPRNSTQSQRWFDNSSYTADACKKRIISCDFLWK